MPPISPGLVTLVLVFLTTAPAAAQPAAPDLAQVRRSVQAWRQGNEPAILREFVDLLALPNVASDRVAIRRNAEHILLLLRKRGIESKLLEAEGSPPVVFGELRSPGARRTIVLYAHYDGQPVTPSEWATPPWKPTLRSGPLPEGRELPIPSGTARTEREWRLYARAAGDDKAPVVAILAAIDALRASRVAPTVNLKLFFEGEEEAGSPHLRAMLSRHAKLLHADGWLFCDGPVHQSRRPQLVFGVRGMLGLELTVYGAARTLHSGHYGNWAPNPAAVLAGLVSGLRDADGRILVAGFHDDVRPATAAERRALGEMPDVDTDLRRELALAATEAEGAKLSDRLMLPAINVRGISSGHVGAAAANAIPTDARASIDFRLVPDQTPEKVRALVEKHLRKAGYHVVGEEPTLETRRAHARVVRLQWGGGYRAQRTSMDLPLARAAIRVLEETLGAPLVKVPTLGGSLPTYVFEDVLKASVVVLPIANHDNNQHAANENLRLANLWDAIEMYAGLLAGLGPAWP